MFIIPPNLIVIIKFLKLITSNQLKWSSFIAFFLRCRFIRETLTSENIQNLNSLSRQLLQ